MARKNPRPEVSRRKFLAGVAVAGAATTVASPPDVASAATPPIGAAKIPSALRPTAQQIAIETEIQNATSEAAQFAQQSPWPEATTATEHVFAESNGH